jgi:NADH-quinone oxidoreductase subunit J
VSARDVVFLAIAGLTCVSAVLAVTSSRVLHAALWLVVTLGSVAACYLLLGAELVALVQLLVYVGGVIVVLLFALMLTRADGAEVAPVDTSRARRGLAAVIAAVLTALLGWATVALVGWERRPLGGPGNAEIGAQIFDTWVWPFELLSLLLLLALIAAIAVARGAGVTEDTSESEREPEPGAHRRSDEADAR